MDLVGDLLTKLDRMVNDQFESLEFKKFFGVPLTLVQVLCGHDSVTTTEKYVKARWRGIVAPNQVAIGV